MERSILRIYDVIWAAIKNCSLSAFSALECFAISRLSVSKHLQCHRKFHSVQRSERNQLFAFNVEAKKLRRRELRVNLFRGSQLPFWCISCCGVFDKPYFVARAIDTPSSMHFDKLVFYRLLAVLHRRNLCALNDASQFFMFRFTHARSGFRPRSWKLFSGPKSCWAEFYANAMCPKSQAETKIPHNGTSNK